MICYLVRHGKDDETVRGGWSRHPLCEEGIAQVNKQAEHIHANVETLAIKHVYASDLPRAMQTAEMIGKRIGLPVVACPQFREVNNGELAGMKNDVALEKYPGLFWNQMQWEQCYPEGESPLQFYERITAAWEKLTEEIRFQNENVLLVTHGGVIHVILSIVAGVPYKNTERQRRIGYAEMIALSFDGNKWTEA